MKLEVKELEMLVLAMATLRQVSSVEEEIEHGPLMEHLSIKINDELRRREKE